MAVLRQVVGDTLRGVRLRQQRTLREVSSTARVSLGYLSEVERGQKEPSSELLAAIAGALEVELSELFAEVTDTLRREEKLVGAATRGALGHSGLNSSTPLGHAGSRAHNATRVHQPAAGTRLHHGSVAVAAAPIVSDAALLLRSVPSEPTVAA